MPDTSRLARLGLVIDAAVADPAARAAARAELARLDGEGRLDALARAPADPWRARARPAFLWVMYALLLWAVPLGCLAAVRPGTADAVARAMGAYLSGIPEPLYALFATGYLGYTAARTWGEARGAGGRGRAE